MYSYWTLYAVLGLVFCPVSWVIYVISYDWISSILDAPSELSDLLGMSKPLFSSAVFWSVTCLIPTICLLRDFVWKFYQRQFRPREYHIVQELQREERFTNGSRRNVRLRSVSVR